MSPKSPGVKKKCLLPPRRLQNIIESLKKLYENGLFLEKLDTLLLPAGIIDMKSYLKMNLLQLEKALSTLESLPQNKKMILKDKFLTLKKNFLNSKSLKTLAVDLTSKEKDSCFWWNQYSMELSKKLPLPILTDLQELDMNSYSSYVNTSIHNLEFCQVKKILPQKKNLQTNLSPLLPITHPNSMECEDITYSRKIRFYPNKEQKKKLNSYFGATRYIFNKTVNLYKERKFPLSLISARHLIMKNNKELEETDSEYWMSSIPYDTRQLAIKAAISSLKTGFTQLQNGTIKKFQIKNKKKRDKKQVFYVDSRAIKNLNLFPALLKENSKLKVKSKYNNYYNYSPESDVVIQKNGKFYYIIFTKTKKMENNNKEKKNVVSLDPGVRTFQSFYTPEGIVGDIGNKKIKDKILSLELKQDKLKSIISKEKQKRMKNRLSLRCEKLKTKVLNIIKNFQWKASSFLCKCYNNVIIPEFRTQNLHDNLSKYNSRVLNLLSHYKFKEKLKYQGSKYKSKVHVVTEEYTTKTCGKCGNMNHFVGSSKMFWCVKCNIEMERDYQAARNILIKTMGLNLWG